MAQVSIKVDFALSFTAINPNKLDHDSNMKKIVANLKWFSFLTYTLLSANVGVNVRSGKVMKL